MDEVDEKDIVRREVIRELLAHPDGIDPYQFQQKYSVTPGRLAAAIRDLLTSGLMELSEAGLRLTEGGKQWVYKQRLQIFTKPVNRYWRKPPPEVFKEPLGIQ